MTRKTTWKEFHIPQVDHMRKLESYAASSRGAWVGYVIWFERGIGSLETNLPWSELRRWFSYSFIPMPSMFLTADHPSWSEVCSCGKGEQAPDQHDPDCFSFAEKG